MSRAFEAFVGWLLDAVAFFDNIRARRSDDEVTAEYRARQRACVWGTALVLLSVVGIFLVTGLFESLSSAFRHAAPLASMRGTVATVLIASTVLTFGYATYAYWALWRFIKSHRDE